MSKEPRITDVGADAEPPPRPPWLLPAVIGVGGFALGLLVATTIGSTGPSEATPTLPPPPATAPATPSTLAATPTTSVSEEESEPLPTLEDLVPGFEGTLYFVDFASSMSHERMTTWRSEMASPLDTDLPEAGDARLDASGTRMAMVRGQSIDQDFMGGVISLFWNLSKSHRPFPDSDSFLGSGVVGLAWHATEPGQLAWVESDGDETWALKTADVEQPGLSVEPVTLAEFSGIAWPLYWDADHLVVASYEVDADGDPLFSAGPRMAFLDGSGEQLAVIDDWFVGRLGGGEFVLIENPARPDETPGAYLVDASLAPLDDGGLFAAGVPFDVARSVHHQVTGVLVFNEAEDSTTILILDGLRGVECSPASPLQGLFWSADGDWLVAQNAPDGDATEGGRSLFFIDPDTCEEIQVPLPEGTGFLAAVGR